MPEPIIYRRARLLTMSGSMNEWSNRPTSRPLVNLAYSKTGCSSTLTSVPTLIGKITRPAHLYCLADLVDHWAIRCRN